MATNPLHIPRVRQVDEGDWRAMPNLNKTMTGVYALVCGAVMYGIWKGLCEAYQLARSLLL